MFKVSALLALGVSASADEVSGQGKSRPDRKKGTSCSTDVTYQVEITNSWTNVDHPHDYPSDAHLSPSIGVSHSSDFGMWAPGFHATSGVQSIAETGSTADMETEMSNDSAYVHGWNKLSGGFYFTDNAVAEILPEELTLEVSEGFSYVSTMHMLAGSPDWFTGVSGLNLCQDGKWVSEVTVTSQPYDAGTDCGASYKSDNCVSDPQENVHSITSTRTTTGTDGPIFVNNDAVAPVATWKFYIQGEGKDDDSKPKPKAKAKARPAPLVRAPGNLRK